VGTGIGEYIVDKELYIKYHTFNMTRKQIKHAKKYPSPREASPVFKSFKNLRLF